MHVNNLKHLFANIQWFHSGGSFAGIRSTLLLENAICYFLSTLVNFLLNHHQLCQYSVSLFFLPLGVWKGLCGDKAWTQVHGVHLSDRGASPQATRHFGLVTLHSRSVLPLGGCTDTPPGPGPSVLPLKHREQSFLWGRVGSWHGVGCLPLVTLNIGPGPGHLGSRGWGGQEQSWLLGCS